jgi:hypothetical protein
MITRAELDRAVRAGQVELGRPNARPVRCSVEFCRNFCAVGEAAQVWIGDIPRGFLCRRACIPRTHQGRA